MTQFNSSWKSSTNPGKQRKYRSKAPNHIKSRLISASLNKVLREKYSKRSLRVKKGDKVKILRGQFRGKEGKVDRINVKNEELFIAGIESQKTDGSKIFLPIHPSNVIITDLNLDDKKRQALLKRK